MGYRRRRKFFFSLLGILIVSLILSCGMRMSVSLTGGSVHPEAKTAYVGVFPNNAPLVNPTLSQEFTDAVKDRIRNQTPLMVVNEQNADYTLTGEIITYSITPVAIQGNDMAAMNRLTIGVRVRFTNRFDETQNFEQTISRYVDYLSSLSFTSIEAGLVAQINEAISEEIFNKAFVNW
ncbi:MAG TPA: LptE family protein [Bacteroidales bacterium]|nr:LptE family protein [Bacteroidales bacterium]HOH22517.1 LptE family protein [Bacteroidales bacterium]HPB57827.1 LptE family protein [Bacteroidales bacterium]HPZ02979.1 LptE family protein [Bacteroidales bacterium]HQB75383.1 LptE family protein [Bacteroidales bacterium]